MTEPASWAPLALRLLGVGLIGFALQLVLIATNRLASGSDVMLIVLADLFWIVGSAALILFARPLFTPAGLGIMLAVAAIVGGFAVGQFVGARRIVPPASRVDIRTRNGMLVARVRRKVLAPAATVWNVMTDHSGYADVASNISRVDVLSGDGLGMIRRCSGPRGESWTETCDVFDEGRAFGFQVHTDAPDYPYPIADLRGRWSVEPDGAGAVFAIDIEATPKGGPIARALFRAAAKRSFKAVLVDLADAWTARTEQEAATSMARAA